MALLIIRLCILAFGVSMAFVSLFAPSSKKPHTRTLALSLIIFLVIATMGLVFWWQRPNASEAANKNYDVVVVGAGPGGIAASIQAARMGAHVALLEETDWLGGQMAAAGVGTMDEGSPQTRQNGLYKEFVDRVNSFYANKQKSVGTCYYGTDNLCVDPQTAQAILKQMLLAESPRLEFFTNTEVTGVIKHGDVVQGVVAGSKRFAAKVVIDATEYGDITDKAGAAYRLGNTTSDKLDPNACLQNITYTAVLKYYPQGVPNNLKVVQTPPYYTENTAKHFSVFLKQGGYDLKPKPDGKHAFHQYPLSFQAYVAYRGVPDITNPSDYNALQQNGQLITRTSLNLANDYPSTGELKTKYITDPVTRATDNCKAKLLTLQLIYYIQHDMGQTNWSVANDEGYDTPYNSKRHCHDLNGYEDIEHNMSQEPYVREARRIVGLQTLTGDQLQFAWKDRSKLPTFANSIAVGYYPMDLHGCDASESLEPGMDSTSDMQPDFTGHAFEVPMGILIPQKIDGLLAAEKNVSTSRLANGALREQPIAMDIGQADGALAALAASQNTQPRNIKATDVQAVLHKYHAATTINE